MSQSERIEPDDHVPARPATGPVAANEGRAHRPESAAPSEPVSFGGRYWLLRPLATGGMAEIYLARQDAMNGFEKEVVIKRLKPELSADARIVDMFLDEARTGALLNHPNIVHVYDVGLHDGVPFIAMEYIVGEELNELCRRGLGMGKFLPLEHAVELIRQAAAGMGYFHAKKAPPGTKLAGQSLDIVHCDISPSNLLVTEDGFLKVIDFGIARANGQRARDEGVLPGKLSYMSPEQAMRQAVDHRSDIYSLGIVLYEITVGRRLFKGKAQDVIARLIEGQIQPPTFVNRAFPAGLETIVMRALERHPDDRYQSAYDLADDLEEFLRDARMHSGPVRIARYLDELSHMAGRPRRPELISEDEAPGREDELDFDTGVFESFSPADLGLAGGEWDELEERDEEVAAALGLDLEELRALRTPVPGRSEDPRPADPRAVDPRAVSQLPLVAPDETPSPSPALLEPAERHLRAGFSLTPPVPTPTVVPPAPAPVPAPAPSPAPAVAPAAGGLWLGVILGALLSGGIGAALYFLL
jgi:serine/threonine protein kinase